MRIDAKEAISLAALIRRDLTAIRNLIDYGHNVTAGMEPSDRMRVESLGYTLHNAYNALENAFTQISLTFENHLKDRERWHRELLDKMFLDMTPLRPRLLPGECRSILNELLAFRHLFRHAYDFELDRERVLSLWGEFTPQAAAILGSLEAFARLLDQAAIQES